MCRILFFMLTKALKEKLLKGNKGKQIEWLQKILVECCFAKLCCASNRISTNTDSSDTTKITIIEPVPHHCICNALKFKRHSQILTTLSLILTVWCLFSVKKQSVPVVPWNAEQNSILLYQPFISLLHKLGFHLPSDAGMLFVRIPEFWTADILFSVAEKLGPIDKCKLSIYLKYYLWMEGTTINFVFVCSNVEIRFEGIESHC